jgi:hypothetical protein
MHPATCSRFMRAAQATSTETGTVKLFLSSMSSPLQRDL